MHRRHYIICWSAAALPISPFAGYEQSAIGRELGKHSIELYTQIKSVYVKLQ